MFLPFMTTNNCIDKWNPKTKFFLAKKKHAFWPFMTTFSYKHHYMFSLEVSMEIFYSSTWAFSIRTRRTIHGKFIPKCLEFCKVGGDDCWSWIRFSNSQHNWIMYGWFFHWYQYGWRSNQMSKAESTKAN